MHNRSWERKLTLPRTVADFCSFVMHKCVHPNGKYFNPKSELELDDKYEKIRHQDKLQLGDYKMPDIF